MAKIGIIIGSTRPGRFGTQPAAWLKQLSKEHPAHTYEIVDIADAELPLLDEATPALMNQYEHAHTKAWSKKIASYDGYIFVTPEYNHTIASSLTNAINYLYHEWAHKAVAFVSYGAEGGGSRAIEHLRAVVGHLGMFDVQTSLIIPNYYNHLDENGAWQADDQQTERAHKLLSEVGFWSNIMIPARVTLAKQ